jgi:two-component system, LuxR family, response regulator FixJ
MIATPTVFLVDDDPAILRALERLLMAEGLHTRAFRSPEAFLREHDPAMPGCVVLDMIMPHLNGLALQQELRASGCDRFIIFITGQSDIPSSVQAMKAGAVDFLIKPFSDQTFLAAVRDAIAKDHIAREICAQLQSIRERLSTLTPREYEVLRHIIAGQLNKQIAADLGTVEKTIKVHRARVMDKMRVASLAELVRLTVHIGLQSADAQCSQPKAGLFEVVHAPSGREPDAGQLAKPLGNSMQIDTMK